MDEIGLFPLEIVLLPTERVPLHIFEERYKELLGECIEAEAEFGLVYADDQGVRDVGTRARVERVLNEFPDGRMDVLVEGGERFLLEELTSGRSFQTGRVSALEDEEDQPEQDEVERALGLFERLVGQLSLELAGTKKLSQRLPSRSLSDGRS